MNAYELDYELEYSGGLKTFPMAMNGYISL